MNIISFAPSKIFIMKKNLEHYTAYNLWANNEMIKCVEQITVEQLHQTIESSFNSVFKTILHIWDAEYIWLQRMQGNSINDWPSKMMDKEGFSTNAFLSNSASFNDFVENADQSFIDRLCDYTNLKGEKLSTPFGTIVMHCMNHSTYHRGQLVTMYRQLGLKEIPSTDLITFDRTR
jgi:uncharacterized damage-inducible protein DinB